MFYIILLIGLFLLELVYFRIADFFNIIDKPNERSSHTAITLRGGGIIFYFAVVAYFITSEFQYPWFFIGLTMMAIVSFFDDVFTLSNRIRLLVHFAAVLLMAYELDVFGMSLFFLLSTFIVIVGVINAYNFMDGINGITASYSLSVSCLLVWVNLRERFIDQDLLVYVILAILVFAFFNFRNKAKCFAGDVGSVSIAYILLFAIGCLILRTGNLIYLLFLSIYGIDAVWTIIRRLYLKENIFEAHRSHLYQFLGNEAGLNKLSIASGYGLIQFLIGLLVIYIAGQSIFVQWFFSLTLLIGLSVIYMCLKAWIIGKYVKPHTLKQ